MSVSGSQKQYKRILLKLSGEELMGSEGFGIDPKVLDRMALEIGQLVGIGVQVGLVIGGGNLFRGAALNEAGMDRVTGDHMGMLATVMNALAMRQRGSSRHSQRRSGRRTIVATLRCTWPREGGRVLLWRSARHCSQPAPCSDVQHCSQPRAAGGGGAHRRAAHQPLVSHCSSIARQKS